MEHCYIENERLNWRHDVDVCMPLRCYVCIEYSLVISRLRHERHMNIEILPVSTLVYFLRMLRTYVHVQDGGIAVVWIYILELPYMTLTQELVVVDGVIIEMRAVRGFRSLFSIHLDYHIIFVLLSKTFVL